MTTKDKEPDMNQVTQKEESLSGMSMMLMSFLKEQKEERRTVLLWSMSVSFMCWMSQEKREEM